MSISDPASLDRLDAAIDSVSSSRARIGAASNRLDSQIRSLKVAEENPAAAGSRIEDTDYAAEASNRTGGRILGEFEMALQVQGRRLQSKSVLGLLG